MPICAVATRRLLTFVHPLSWAGSRILGLFRSRLAQASSQGRAIDGFANSGNSVCHGLDSLTQDGEVAPTRSIRRSRPEGILGLAGGSGRGAVDYLTDIPHTGNPLHQTRGSTCATL
jgi:hypothetical protein